MIQTSQAVNQLSRTLEEFLVWVPNDGYKYEWNDGELIQFAGMKKEQLYINKTNAEKKPYLKKNTKKKLEIKELKEKGKKKKKKKGRGRKNEKD